MTVPAEAICTGSWGTTVAEGTPTAWKSATESEALFASLLAALSYALVSQEDGTQAAVQALTSDVSLDAAGAVGESALPPEGATPVRPESWSGTGQLLVPDASCPEESGLTPAIGTATLTDSGETFVPQGAHEPAGEQIEIPRTDTLRPVSLQEETVAAALDEGILPAGRVQALARQDGYSPPEPQPLSNAPVPAAEVNPAEVAGFEAVTSTITSGAKNAPSPQEGVESKGEAPIAEIQGSVETESAPVHFTPARTGSDLVNGESTVTGTQPEAQQGGDESARSLGNRLYAQNAGNLHDVRTQHIADTNDTSVPRVADDPRAQVAQSVIDQTVRSVLLSVRNESSQLRVRLKPPHLGELHLRLVFKDDVLNIDLNTQSTVVRNVIETNLSQLHQALEKSGVALGRVSVTVDPELSSGGHFSREPSLFHPSGSNSNGTYGGTHEDEESSLKQWLQRARRRYTVGQIDLIA